MVRAMRSLSGNLAQARARKALDAAGIRERGTITQLPSLRSDVFVTDTLTVRLNDQPNSRFRREAKLLQALAESRPGHTWLPTVVAFAGDDEAKAEAGADYLILERQPGSPLSRWWPDLLASQRREAIEQLANHLKALHETPVPPSLPTIDASPHLLRPGQRPTAELQHGLTALARSRFVDKGLLGEARAGLEFAAASLLADPVDDETPSEGFPSETLVHGNLTFDNVMWDGTAITAIVDYEWSRGAPADLDLDIFLRFCANSDAAEVPRWLLLSYPELFGHPRLNERLFVYALAFETKAVLEDPPTAPRADLGPFHPYNRFASLVTTTAHLAPSLAALGHLTR